MGKIKKEAKIVGEKLLNIPNPLSALRIVLSLIIVLLAIEEHKISLILIIFVIAALTDFLDGFIARRYNQVTNFGRRLDIIADRTLTISVIFIMVFYLYMNSLLDKEKVILFLMIASREIISIPVFFIAMLKKNSRKIPHARFIGKITTAFQFVAFPMIFLGWKADITISIITFVLGIIASCYYTYDSIIKPNNVVQKKLDKYYEDLQKIKR